MIIPSTSTVLENIFMPYTDLRWSFYRKTAANGHTGRDKVQLPWVNKVKVATLKKAAVDMGAVSKAALDSPKIARNSLI
jgi:hypothetical protein